MDSATGSDPGGRARARRFRQSALAGTIVAAGASLVLAATALADFPYAPGGNPHDPTTFHLGPGVVPNDLTGGTAWKYSATPEANNPLVNGNPRELNGERGAHLVDPDPSAATGWKVSTGRPDVNIAVLDSGIEWNDAGAMHDLAGKIALNRHELPTPNHARTLPMAGSKPCASFVARDDANGDGVFNVYDFACDSRVSITDPRRIGPQGVLTPQDLIIAFSDGRDSDRNGYVDDIAGWDFLDNDNDPYDDVRYGHGTGEALDSNAEANNGGDLGACPNCTVTPLRVGDSFIADANRFAAGVTYAVDNGSLVVQEALGALNNTSFARNAVDYAYAHGVAVIASAADEAAQHHNYPSSLPHTIVVNSVRDNDELDLPHPPGPNSYLRFDGCTNFSSKITLSIPSTSCSSEATGRSAGMAGVIYSAAINAHLAGRLPNHPTCKRVSGRPCVLSANEVRQLMASGSVAGIGRWGPFLADDVNFASVREPSCTPQPTAGCTDPNGALQFQVNLNRLVTTPLFPVTTSYPARRGFDQFYGYGRINVANSATAASAALIPPEVEITSPDWFATVDPNQANQAIGAQIDARGTPYTCSVQVAPGSYPNEALATDNPPGDYRIAASSWCDGHTAHTTPFSGDVADLSIAALRRQFPPDPGNFNGPLPPAASQKAHGRPNSEPFGFTVRVIATTAKDGHTLVGRDRRNLYLHRDAQMLAGFPQHLPSDGDSSPLLADIDGDNHNELVYGTADGLVHAIRRDGRELPGWPVRTDPFPLHAGSRAFTSGAVPSNVDGAIVGALAAGDLRHDGSLDVVATDLEGQVYAWDSHGHRIFHQHSNPLYGGQPPKPFDNVRVPTTGRVQHAFLTAPVIADLDGDGVPEIVAAAMDRHVYAWHSDGSPVKGFPVEVVDPSKVASIDPRTHAVTFRSGVGAGLLQGAIVDTPAVGDLNGDGRPEIVVGTNEEYSADQDGGLNASVQGSPSLATLAPLGLLSYGNSRVYAIRPQGNAAPGGPLVPGWPFKVGLVNTELLPVVGEGVTGSPVISNLRCPSGGEGAKVGVTPGAGVGYLLNGDGSSCYGNGPDGKAVGLATDLGPVNFQRGDLPNFPAVGQPAFGAFPGGPALVAPVSALRRALDVIASDYQGGEDFIGAWNGSSGQFANGFPAPVDDLQFLTGPSIADIDGKPGEEVLGSSAYLDLNAFSSSTGRPVPGYPKLTTDWTVTNPTIGSFGTFDLNAGVHKAVISLTRSGYLFAYDTTAPACSPASWPRFHHDLANSGDAQRDAIPPGRPFRLRRSGRRLSFEAPGDDLMCGTAARYEVVTSDHAISGAAFPMLRHLSGAPKPAAPGPSTRQGLTLPADVARCVAVRAVDDQGNLGPPAAISTDGSRRPCLSSGAAVAPRIRAVAPHACVRGDFRLRVSVRASTPLRSLRISLGARRLVTSTRSSLRVRVPARRLAPGGHALVVTARDRTGASARRVVRFRRCAPRAAPEHPRFTG